MQKNATYYKIREVLKAAKPGNASLAEVALRIAKSTEAFVYYKRERDGRVREFTCDMGTIRSKIRFCYQLGLLEGDDRCRLTAIGKNALAPGKGKFDLQIQQAVIAYLEANDLPIARLESAIGDLLLSDPASLHQYLGRPIAADVFRTCLFLLSECAADDGHNILIPYAKKIYLTQAKLKKAEKTLKGAKP